MIWRRGIQAVCGISIGLLVGSGCSFFAGDDSDGRSQEERIAAVEVAEIERRPLDLERTFSGALEAVSRVVIAPKVGGRIEQLEVDLGDPIEQGQTVAHLDDAEFAQAVKQAEAEQAVANANLAQARQALEISRRENQRIESLRESGVASDSQYDVAQADFLEKEAQVKVAEAQINRAMAFLESAKIRFGYTRVIAHWTHGDEPHVVAERYVDEGENVSANQALLLVVDLDPIIAVLSVTERDYGRLRPGMEARFETDAFPGEVFQGRIMRVAPVFQVTSRQARVELSIHNSDGRLKPGMFVRATIGLDRIEAAIAVPESALTRRGEIEGVFLADAEGRHAHWKPVEVGIRANGWVQLLNTDLSGRVVTLGQHLIDDGSPIRIAGTFDRSNNP